jgi:hypothetical protein
MIEGDLGLIRRWLRGLFRVPLIFRDAALRQRLDRVTPMAKGA